MEHTFKKSPKHDCGRCGTTRSLSELRWQNGILVCSTNDCHDTALVGQREADIIRILTAVQLSDEGQPDPKLKEPSIVSNDNDLIFNI